MAAEIMSWWAQNGSPPVVPHDRIVEIATWATEAWGRDLMKHEAAKAILDPAHNPSPEQMIAILSDWVQHSTATINKATQWAVPILWHLKGIEADMTTRGAIREWARRTKLNGEPNPSNADRCPGCDRQITSIQGEVPTFVHPSMALLHKQIEDWHEAEETEAERSGVSEGHRERATERTMTLFRVLGLFVAAGSTATRNDPDSETCPVCPASE